jgi:hypothetical protein
MKNKSSDPMNNGSDTDRISAIRLSEIFKINSFQNRLNLLKEKINAIENKTQIMNKNVTSMNLYSYEPI